MPSLHSHSASLQSASMCQRGAFTCIWCPGLCNSFPRDALCSPGSMAWEWEDCMEKQFLPGSHPPRILPRQQTEMHPSRSGKRPPCLSWGCGLRARLQVWVTSRDCGVVSGNQAVDAFPLPCYRSQGSPDRSLYICPEP